ncbi:AP-5 complex subunit mu-1 isoform X2 [Pipistrellus kuhlii]|uniref:AP-5 complex subunit mu-1 n=1 Tax=Pipistrellus kuhlii TaxID=59472 RepID=A0A7J8AYF6_PIPKU|nr:AP-5 complex subunit mu-1 isoform X2 [Pipistrellus kuhlii]XP_036291557.1 AP-5 complex subunit mu-1 isoform X2 [Pipistrellus kuhlii]KAF6391246.1 adaptor related protein complex 5 subunit mu 1 [Pipistrellus kuhlii]
MAQRAVWLVSHEPGTPLCGTVRFSRRFPTVEKRAKVFNGTSYVPIPEDGPFLKSLLFELRLLDEDKDFMESRDSCSRINKTSVYGLKVGGEELWPVVAFLKNGIVYACVPLVEQTLSPRPALISISAISQGFELLFGIQDFLYSSQRMDTELNTKLSQLPDLLLQACPFGTVLDANLQNSLDSINFASVTHPQKQPAWKAGTYKGKPQVSISITEKVKSMQYDKQDIADTWQVVGTVTCKCDLEGIMPNVTISLSLPTNGSPLQDILVHPCVTSLDSAILTSSSIDTMDDSAFSGPYKFPFTPPLESFNLCYYTSQVPVPPILGFYQIKEEEAQLKITVNLKLHESVKNNFEFCEAHIPFYNRGPITHVEYKVSFGQLEVFREKSLLIWIIGQKFPKSMEISLSGTITFGAKSHDKQPFDHICIAGTAYLKLHFRILDYTLTGCYADQHSVQVFASGKPKISTHRKLISSDYYIWNSKAPAPVTYGSLLLNLSLRDNF